MITAQHLMPESLLLVLGALRIINAFLELMIHLEALSLWNELSKFLYNVPSELLWNF
jgi:hypothetical protein